MSDSPTLENLLQQGISAVKQGNSEGAKVLFQRVLAEDKKNDRAWYWMAYIAKDRSKRKQYLETALEINPKNKSAKKALVKMQKKRQGNDQRTLWIGGVVVLLVLVVSTLLILVAVLANS